MQVLHIYISLFSFLIIKESKDSHARLLSIISIVGVRYHLSMKIKARVVNFFQQPFSNVYSQIAINNKFDTVKQIPTQGEHVGSEKCKYNESIIAAKTESEKSPKTSHCKIQIL